MEFVFGCISSLISFLVFFVFLVIDNFSTRKYLEKQSVRCNIQRMKQSFHSNLHNRSQFNENRIHNERGSRF